MSTKPTCSPLVQPNTFVVPTEPPMTLTKCEIDLEQDFEDRMFFHRAEDLDDLMFPNYREDTAENPFYEEVKKGEAILFRQDAFDDFLFYSQGHALEAQQA
ncbi:unnamed protein product [Aphanomyces euteiches]|uniref:Uncharacterized protein n=1 Tax=Aphanomyces euteiches TaxID=100861 RepID=A0A6G0XJ77_9STRA|nr:hypothetical protein Ae201684_004102 [Aphanomyces euteiches]KAH9093720.1 hypothetical protein Ae201684P_016343 [Aphanomyces euteiches]KAH9143862.1 hypothetical protein AeRB84_012161 [Aphanomyces euteiches]